MRLSPRLALLLTVPPLLWAGNAVVGRLAIGSMPPLTLNAMRWALALVLLLPLGWRALGTTARRAQARARWAYLATIALLGVGAYNALQYLALRTSTPLNVTLIASSTPLWTLMIGALVFGERPHGRQMAGALLSLVGVAVVLSRGRLDTLLAVKFVVGDLLMLVAAAGWAFYSWMLARPPGNMRGEHRPDWTWAEFLCLQMALGLGWATAGAALLEWWWPATPPMVQWSPWLVAALAYVAIGPSLLAYRLWGLGVAEAGPAMATIFANLTPLFAALLSAAVLGDWPQGYHALAFALIVAGIVLPSRR